MSSPLEATASISLDLDDKWTYMKTRGLAGWQSFPSYLPIVVPRVLRFLRDRSLRITFFLVGQDAALPHNASLLRSIAEAGHEIGNHSFHHEPWLHLYSRDEIEREIELAESHIRRVTGSRILGFRGPGFTTSKTVMEVLATRGYRYDASALPTFIGPVARAYYMRKANLSAEERRRRSGLYGNWRDGLHPLKPRVRRDFGHPLVEIPVTTTPVFRTPFHLSYLIWLSGHSDSLARAYLRLSLALCRARGVGPSFLLHPLDFLESGEAPELEFFPGMRVPLEQKMELADFALKRIVASFQIRTLEEQASSAAPAALEIAPSGTCQPATLASAKRCAYVMPVFQAQTDFDDTMRSLALSPIPCTAFVVDDGSRPPLQVPDYGPRLTVRLIRFPINRGIVAALNCGLQAALAEGFDYIARIDAGDFSTPDRLARQMAYLEKHPDCALVGSDAVVRDQDGAYCFTIEPPRDPRQLNKALHERAWLLHPSVMFRASVVREVGLYSGAYKAAEDYEMFLRIAATRTVGVVPMPLLTYVQRRSSISGRNGRLQAISRLRVQIRYFEWTNWLSYYGVLSTIGTLFIPRWAKHRFKTKFLYSQNPPSRVTATSDVSVNESGS